MTETRLTPLVMITAFVLMFGGIDKAHANTNDQSNDTAPIIVMGLSKPGLMQWTKGQEFKLLGADFKAKTATMALTKTSSEFVSIAVISGELTHLNRTAGPGQIFIIPIAAKEVLLHDYDAALLRATLPKETLALLDQPLKAIAKTQKTKLFWGLLEPTRLNIAAPINPIIESARQSYLSAPAIVELRHKSSGDFGLLQTNTVQTFIDALLRDDGETVAALIDPMPFSDATNDTKTWQSARRSFADTLLQDRAIKQSLSDAQVTKDASTGQFSISGKNGPPYILTTVQRDSAVFIGAFEVAQ